MSSKHNHSKNSIRVALVYDRVNKWGGAERVLLALHELFPDAPLFTSVYNPQTAPWAKSFTIYTSFLQKIPFVKKSHEYYPFLMPLAFESFSFDEFDMVISVTSEAAKGIITKPHTLHICLCLTPTRYLWSGYREYFAHALFRFLVSPLIWYLRTWDTIAANRPDTYIAISQEVQKRIKMYYGKDATVIYPSVPFLPKSSFIPEDRDYFLVVSRLSKFTQYKRVDLAIRAATALSIPLVVVGEGNKKRFEKMAGPTVRFVGKVTDAQLYGYYAYCKALIFPAHEDLGLVMLEAQAAGKPVIAYRSGGALEIVQEVSQASLGSATGMFFDTQTEASLVEALKNFDESAYNKDTCKRNAERFSKKRFEESFLHFVEQELHI